MAETIDTLEKNWYKAVTAMKFTKEGLQEFVANISGVFHQKVYNIVLAGVPPGTMCNTCSLQTVLDCPTKGICGNKSNCFFHDKKDPNKQPRTCPQNICTHVRDEIRQHHRYRKPSFKNTTPQSWQTSYSDRDPSWEIAKCYMAPTGYESKYNAEDTDFSGLINVIINNTDFQTVITENLDQDYNLFEQARDVRNSIIHDSNLQTSTAKYKYCLVVLTQILSDPKHIQALPASQGAVTKIRKLDADEIVITTEDKRKIREEALEAIQSIKDATCDAKQVIATSKCVALTELDAKRQAIVDTIDKATLQAVETVRDKTAENSGTSSCHSNKVDLLERSSDLSYSGGRNNTRSEGDSRPRGPLQMDGVPYGAYGAKVTNIGGDGAINNFGGVVNVSGTLNLCAGGNRDLQKYLIQHYKTKGYFNMPVSPLVADVDVDVEKLFVMPSMEIPEHGPPISPVMLHATTSQGTGIPVKSLADMFKKNGESIRRVCLSGDAGHGKTTLCQMIISAWCKINSNEYHHLNDLDTQDIDFLKSFEYLFYLPLRHLATLSDVKEMIKTHLVRKKHHSLIDDVIEQHSEKCLIIIDGLDEWSASCSLPYIDDREECSVLMTSRQWKLENIRPKSSEMQQEVRVRSLYSNNKLLKKLVNFLNEKHHRNRDYKTSPFYKLSPFSDPLHKMLRRFSEIPILLTQMVCMWFDDKGFGETRIEICCNIINMLLEVATNRIRKEGTPMMGDIQLSQSLLSCFEKYAFFSTYSVSIQTLAKLAFYTLFSDNKENALVFSQSVNDFYGISHGDIDFCLKTGLLSQSKFIEEVTSSSKKFSFLHKNFHEFFAAVFIADDVGCKHFSYMWTKLTDVDAVLEMSHVITYLCGLRPDLIDEISFHMSEVVDKNKLVKAWRCDETKATFPRNVFEIQNLLVDCYIEAHKARK